MGRELYRAPTSSYSTTSDWAPPPRLAQINIYKAPWGYSATQRAEGWDGGKYDSRYVVRDVAEVVLCLLVRGTVMGLILEDWFIAIEVATKLVGWDMMIRRGSDKMGEVGFKGADQNGYSVRRKGEGPSNVVVLVGEGVGRVEGKVWE
ncbi:hypothetical protein Tco_0066467 [Tanacetum coccineum]